MSFPFGPKVDEADVKETADSLAREAGAVLIDVREPDEWRAGHARGARHIPLTQLPASGLPDLRHGEPKPERRGIPPQERLQPPGERARRHGGVAARGAPHRTLTRAIRCLSPSARRRSE
jgi:hypothetical protein